MSITTPCQTADELHKWVRLHLNMNVPRKKVCQHHSAPFDYLVNAYFEPAVDQIVWAPRGGGKTSLAAVATLLDLLHKPGTSVRILGGSLEQSLKMWESLLPHLEHLADDLIDNPRATARRVRLSNGSVAAVLTQSQKSVRGLRVQKLRCDEVELFDEQVWSAAQLVTRSMRTSTGNYEGTCDLPSISNPEVPNIDQPGEMTTRPTERGHATTSVRGTIEALSTLHRPFGLMQQIVDTAAANGTRIVRWCLLDVLERCPPERECATCPLLGECGGIAKTDCDGFFSIDDAIAMKARVSEDVWKCEMLCQRPSTRGRVFPMFEESVHLREELPNLQTADLWLAMDFGYCAPFVCLWIAVDRETVYVFDEYLEREKTLAVHLSVIDARPWPKVRRVACDPAGASRNEQTARSNIDLLHAHGLSVKTRGSHIVDGIELMRAALKSAGGQTRLYIHPRCRQLIKAMQTYRYADDQSELPLKDGTADHPIDALRYFFINARKSTFQRRDY